MIAETPLEELPESVTLTLRRVGPEPAALSLDPTDLVYRIFIPDVGEEALCPCIL